MKKQGLIYHHGWPTTGEVILVAKKGAKLAYGLARGIGSALIVAGLAGVLLTLQPVVSSELKYRLSRPSEFRQGVDVGRETQIANRRIEIAQAKEEEEREKVRQLARDLGLPDSKFSVYIPKIDAKAQILENVNPADPEIYMESLKKGVAHSAGSVFPGVEGATFLFAHSTNAPWNVAQYNAVFYLLRELEPGDEIYVFFLDKLYKYRMSQKQVVAAEDLSWLEGAMQGPERLILQTCWPPGTTLKRLIVAAEPVD